MVRSSMERVMVVVSALLVAAVLTAGPAWGMQPGPQSGTGCGPQSCYVTKMVPCVRTEMVPQVRQCQTVVPVQKVGYTNQKVLVKGTPVGCSNGGDPCVKCCPQPFCQVVCRPAPYVYYEYKTVPYYSVTYSKVCRTVWMPQVYKMDYTPLCK
ncbi:MAG: hypothetical protein V2B18_23800 [Pseudomonadota bacterium]